VIRRQLPAYSPQSPWLLWRAACAAVKSQQRVRSDLREYLCTRFDADQAVLTGSGTQALQLALAMARKSEGGESVVALPAYSCYDLVTAAVGAGERIVFYDLDPTTLTPDADSLRVALSIGATTVVAASLFGFPIDWTWLRRECERFGATLVEDSAQGLGSEWHGTEGGSFGDLTVLSFGRGKGWTGGSGGALLLRSSEPRGYSRASTEPKLPSPGLGADLRALVVSSALSVFGRPTLYRLPSSMPGLGLGVTQYREPSLPTGISAFAAAAALRHAELASQAVAGRRTLGAAWTEILGDLAGGMDLRACRPLTGGESGYLRFPALARDRDQAAEICARARDEGVARGYPLALPELPAARRIDVGRNLPQRGAKILAARLFTFPTHPRFDPKDVSRVSGLL
jgi:dTDP-4-amino-4,6-dideoxygalactose transaminase